MEAQNKELYLKHMNEEYRETLSGTLRVCGT